MIPFFDFMNHPDSYQDEPMVQLMRDDKGNCQLVSLKDIPVGQEVILINTTMYSYNDNNNNSNPLFFSFSFFFFLLLLSLLLLLL